jgi:hypothetical protein
VHAWAPKVTRARPSNDSTGAYRDARERCRTRVAADTVSDDAGRARIVPTIGDRSTKRAGKPA